MYDLDDDWVDTLLYYVPLVCAITALWWSCL